MSGDHHHDHCKHDHAHDHHHDHHHDHRESRFKKALIFGIGLNLFFSCLELFMGFYTHSLALISDAGHNFSDVLSLVISLFALWLTKIKISPRFSFGLKNSSIFAAFFNSAVLLLACGIIIWEASMRFKHPGPINSDLTLIVASIGFVINLFSAYLFHGSHHHDLNAKSAFLHLMGDALVSLGVVASSLVIKYTHSYWIDPLVSLFIALVIIYSSFGLFKESFFLLIKGTPNQISLPEIKNKLATFSGVKAILDLHLWAMSTTENILSAHLRVDASLSIDEREALMLKIKIFLRDEFQLRHTSLQLSHSKAIEELDQSCSIIS